MRRTLISILIIAAMVFVGISTDSYSASVTKDISGRLEALAAAPDPAEAAAISEDWERFCANNVYLTNNECAFEISKLLVHIVSEVEDGDDAAEESREAVRLLRIYDMSRSLTLANVF